MTSVAEVLELATWRDEHGVLQRAIRRDPWPFGWHSLRDANLSDARDGAAILARLGGHPIALYGANADGSCMCGNPDCTGNSRGKHPVSKSWQSKPLDLAELDRQIERRPGLSLGWRMGAQPNGWRLIAIDVDGDLSLLDPLVAQWGPLPETLTASTGRGHHLVFRLRDGAAMPKNAVKLSPGVDIRSEGGQIVIAPSRHASGRRYRWTKAIEPAVLP